MKFLTGEIVENVYESIRKQQTKISKFVILHAVNKLRFTLSLTVFEITEITFSRSCELKGHVTLKSKNSKFVILHAVTLQG